MTSVPTRYLQRKCACGGSSGLAGECEGCRKKKLLQRHAGHQSEPSEVPPIVHEVLRSPGRPLDPAARAFFEPRFGHDFSRVRVHTDVRAAESAHAVNAIAYTVGRNVVFRAGEYRPASDVGRRLLAHELAHVVQQDGVAGAPAAQLEVGPADDAFEREADRFAADPMAAEAPTPAPLSTMKALAPPRIQRVPFGAELFRANPLEAESPFGLGRRTPLPRHGSTLPYREAVELVDCVRILGEANAPYCRHIILGEPLPPPPPLICSPSDGGSLTWADYTEVPGGMHPGANTAYNHTREGVAPNEYIRATFDPTGSWVRPQFGARASDRSVNGCSRGVTDCQNWFATHPTATDFSMWPVTGCAAAIPHDMTLRAHDSGECDTVLGAECDRVSGLNSARLLRHEQLHFDIACIMARKGSAAIASGANPARVLAAVVADTERLRLRYDRESNTSCNAAGQANWETLVAGGLSGVTWNRRTMRFVGP